MARLLHLARRSLYLGSLDHSPSSIFSTYRSYISEMRRSAFKENLLRIIRTEITYEAEYRAPLQPPSSFESFSVEDHPGEQWIRLRRKFGEAEDIKVDATMFDGAIPPQRPPAAGGEEGPRMHISVIVEVSKGDAAGFVLQFVCSAWKDSLDVEKVFPVARGPGALRPFSPFFKDLDDELQDATRKYLEERGVNDDLAEFLHVYMENKDKTEYIRWMLNVESYVKK
ncbi:Uncharacterized protein AXF42_Ash020721 [Apostasia shenzhenica]|uniref:Mitochondrial glycoprotein n=1 Tax=Apostasia shenzhenica TaxID=1088818 RepID=A0A2H9ZYC9_9ASPA|nr:Uncharacterized protein AXF42_Ash020721 [Apostasia shenzhenica]